MAQIGSTRYLERVEFFDGERLFASDLQTLEEFQREMRWLHNKSLHQPGVASGFGVTGEKGDRQVSVQPGYAIDSAGQEIVLTETNHIEPLPPVADDGAGNPVTFYLTVSYPAKLIALNQQADCASDPPGAVRLSEVPVFCWVRLNSSTSAGLLQEVELGKRILLATVQVLNCQVQSISVANRSNAKPGVHPRIFTATASLTFVKGKIEFQHTQFGVQLGSKPLDPAAVLTVDTSAAGFQTVPCYFANLIGERTIDLTGGGKASLEPLIGISAPEVGKFQYSLMIPSALLGEGKPDAIAASLNDLQENGKLDWEIEWLGVEG